MCKQGEICTENDTDASNIIGTVTVQLQVWQEFHIVSKVNSRIFQDFIGL